MKQIEEEFDEDRRDALQEVVNIAMGRAGDSLAQLFNTFVELSVPKFYLCDTAKLNELLSGKETYKERMAILKQPFSGQLRGEGIILFNVSGVNELSDLMGYEGEISVNNQREMLLDVCSILVGACLNGIASQFSMGVTYTAPTIVKADATIDDFFQSDSGDWHYALVMEIMLKLEQYSFTSNLLYFLSEESFEPLIVKLDEVLEEL